VEVRIDDMPVDRALADQNGAFALTTRAPGQLGFHVIELFVDGKLVSGVFLAVRPGD
jgi:hypothetical protein